MASSPRLNRDKPHLWKADIERSIDHYNDWFLAFAPEAYRTQRRQRTEEVLQAFDKTANLSAITPQQLFSTPEVLPILRMATAPPIARDRLSGLAYVSKSVIDSMEGRGDRKPRLPKRMDDIEISEHLTRICEVVTELLDYDLFPWLNSQRTPTEDELGRAAAVVADRLTGATADPIIRNAQEQRQLFAIHSWLQRHHFKQIESEAVRNPFQMPPGSYTFHLTLTVGSESNSTNIPIDCAIKPFGSDPASMPILMEAKSAGDATNTNKRRKEEAQKFAQLKARYGANIMFILLLGGYFEPGYLGYEAAEGIDWVWEHRIDDLSQVLGHKEHPGIVVIEEPRVSYFASTHRRESDRVALQHKIDSMKSPELRNRLGQFSTPFPLARQMTTSALRFLPSFRPILFLEPALGTGVFYSALIASAGEHPIQKAVGVELDSDYAQAAQSIWPKQEIEIRAANFLDFAADPQNALKFNLLCTNPPYVRHHHIPSDRKLDLQARIKSDLGLSVSGLSGLYVYFILMAHSVLADDAIASWLVPSEFLVVNYGKALRDYLTQHVTLLELHQFDADKVQFDDALVSSCVVTYAKRRPPSGHQIRFAFGADITAPSSQRIVESSNSLLAGRWTMFAHTAAIQERSAVTLSIGDLFDIKRGIATGANRFFIIDKEKADQYSIPWEFLRPLLPSPRLVHEPIIQGDSDGIPLTKPQLFLVACNQPPEIVKRKYPALWGYFQRGAEQAIDRRYLCESREVWYFQEHRSPSRFLASYMGRSNGGAKSPIRFFLNRSNALVTNVYLHLYPKPHLATLLAENSEREIELLQLLNGIPIAEVLHAGRSYGGGLHKIEPKELAAVPLANPPAWLRDVVFIQLPML